MATPRTPALDTQHVCDTIQHIWGLPLRHGPVVSLREGDIALFDVPKLNTTVFDRAIAQFALQAAQGDVKSFELLMKYGGNQPPEEQHITIDQPTIIDDISDDTINQAILLPATSAEEGEEESAELPVIEFVDDLDEHKQDDAYGGENTDKTV